MINFRYHIVSLTAVFLALIIGILMGTTVVSKATVDGLKANLHRAEVRTDAVHAANDQLSGQLKNRTNADKKIDAALNDNALPNAVDGSLKDVPVLVIATDDVDKDVLNGALASLTAAGADLDGTVVLNDRMVIGESDEDRVRKLLDISSTANVQSALIRQLGIALAGAALPGKSIKGAPTTTTSTTTSTTAVPDSSTSSVPDNSTTTTTSTLPKPVEPDLIAALRDSGLVKFRALDGQSGDAAVLEAPELRDGTGYRYVFLTGTDGDPVATGVVAPLIATLGSLGSVPQVVGVGPKDLDDPGDDAFLSELLKRDGVKGHVSTVDNLGSFTGNVALAYALADAGEGHFGNFGIGDTATSVLPTFERPTD